MSLPQKTLAEHRQEEIFSTARNLQRLIYLAPAARGFGAARIDQKLALCHERLISLVGPDRAAAIVAELRPG